ncbi:MAG: glycerol-3-phosphate 1-O-acyltransferase PlsY [Gammaproteobacteria bacterium]|nr:glycerol-3-phosphate 1-O-acyltransferase PlsY [Gammaproteobacteria bacterium]
MEFLLKVVIAYLLGSIIGALWVGRLLGHVDIREMGSGNAGGTNALRTQGWFFALLVVIIDVGKGVLAAGWLPFVPIPGLAAEPAIGPAWVQVCCAGAAVVGHVFPVYHRFKGGKGAATLLGTLTFISWQAIAVVLVSWLLVVGSTGYVGLATVLAVLGAAAYAGVVNPVSSPIVIFLAVMSVFIVFTHRSNLARMRAGNENRMHKLMILRRAKDSSDDD